MFTVNSDESQNIDHRRKGGERGSFGEADGKLCDGGEEDMFGQICSANDFP